MVAVAAALPQHDLALLGKGAADGGDEPEGLVDGHEEEHALTVVDRLLVVAHVGVHEPHQEPQQRGDAELDWVGRRIRVRWRELALGYYCTEGVYMLARSSNHPKRTLA